MRPGRTRSGLDADGNRFVGPAMVDIFEQVVAIEGEGPFEVEEFFTVGDRAVVRWLHTWDHGNGGGCPGAC